MCAEHSALFDATPGGQNARAVPGTAVADIDRRNLQESPRGFQSFAPWVRGLLTMQVNTEHGKEPVLVQWMDVDWLTSLVQPAGISTASPSCTTLASSGSPGWV